MKSNRKLTDWFEYWNQPTTTYVMVFLCALYETMMLTRLILAPDSANRTLRQSLDNTEWGLPLFVAIIILSLVLLCLRRRRPTATLLATTILMLLTAVIYGSAYTYLLLVWLIDLYACTVETRNPKNLIACLIPTVLLGLATTILATLWRQDADLIGLLYPTTMCFALCVGLGLVSRTQRERHRSEQALSNERERSQHLAQERDQAVNQSRIAAELHDSVGHNLTAIIALSEGLGQITGKPEVDDAIIMINELARQGLTDTRTAVKALQPSTNTDGLQLAPVGQKQAYHWDDINPIINHARQIGMTVALTETGRRPQDTIQANLSFIITREAITNTLRHGCHADRIVISWDHDSHDGITISVRDNGKPVQEASSIGTGLNRLQETLRGYGGSLKSGPTSNGWLLQAHIPSLKEPADSEK
ncbi:Two-component sensor kinase [Bifidobacterium coryneforme]|uniref:histidine kinase n=2 Tax=Bifidobacterium coryneforme TaxID=1687 RepID=A0ABD4ACL5_9BIFI|nr:Two-component sensor kinase [Bifidobacterium coryneforme]